jgi:ABC-type phosphate transport system permease subunit
VIRCINILMRTIDVEISGALSVPTILSGLSVLGILSVTQSLERFAWFASEVTCACTQYKKSHRIRNDHGNWG